MTIEFTEQKVTQRTFMEMVDGSVQEAMEDQVDMTISIALLHREVIGDGVVAMIEATIDDNEPVSFETRMDQTRITDFIEYMAGIFEETAPVPQFALDNIHYSIDNVFSDICNPIAMAAEVKALHAKAEYIGLATQLRFLIHKGKALEVNYIINAEVQIDTSEEDHAKAVELGLGDSFTPSPKDKIIPMVTMSASSFIPV